MLTIKNHTMKRLLKSIAPTILPTLPMVVALIALNPSLAGAESGGIESNQFVSARDEIASALQGLRYGSTLNLEANMSGGDEGEPLFEPVDDVDMSRYDLPGRKSLVKAGIMSLLIPGLGQVYNGSNLGKVGAFAGAEVLFWTQYSRFNGIANDRIDAFETFADTTWNRQEYERYLTDLFGNPSDTGVNFTHHLPGTNTQQYYEMIGKYDQFSYGWTLAEGDTGKIYTPVDNYENNPFASPLRLQYNNMRASANDAFSSRDRMVIFALVNHLVSSIDAALGAARHNRALENGQSSFSVSPSVAPDTDWSIIPKINVSYRF